VHRATLVAAFAHPCLLPAGPPTANEKRKGMGLLLPGREDLGKSAGAALALLHGNNRPFAIAVYDRNVEPRTLLEELNVALHCRHYQGRPRKYWL
jgi:hypothetical protein